MISQLRELRDLLDGIERDGEDWDQGAMDAAISIVETLILANERPLPIPAVNSVYSVKTPVSPAAAAAAPQQPQPQKPRRPKSQQFEINSRKKRKVA